MSHSSHASSPHDHSHWYWSFILVAVVVGMGCGTWGYHIYEHEHGGQGAMLSAAYHALQLFLLHMPHLEGRINGPLEIGRWSAALATGLTGLLFLHSVMLFEWRHLWFKFFTSEHVVVCGLGATGTRIVEALTRQEAEAGEGAAAWLRRIAKALLATFIRKNRSPRVVAIEREHAMPGVAEAEGRGALIVIGDARSEETLRKAGALRATHVLAVCTGDDTNIAIATTLQEMAMDHPAAVRGEVTCQLLWEDFKLREKLAPDLECEDPGQQSGVKVRGINVPDLIARTVFQEHPFDFEGIVPAATARVHLVLVGTCSQARALAVKALQMCHFANRSRLRLTVVGTDAAKFLADLSRQHPGSEPWYDAMTAAPDPMADGLPNTAVKTFDARDYLTVAVCGQGSAGGVPADQRESRAVVMALAVAGQLDALAEAAHGPARRQVLVHLRECTGFAKFLARRSGTAVHGFGAAASFCHPDVLLHGKQDAIAKALNDAYRSRHPGDEWQKLNETFRDSNRLAADHIPVKLRVLGVAAVAGGKRKPSGEAADLTMFREPRRDTNGKEEAPDPTLMILAEMEHSRWCAERYLRGWRLGHPTDKEDEKRLKAMKFSRWLVSWDELPEAERSKDLEQIRAAPAALSSVGKRLVKATPS